MWWMVWVTAAWWGTPVYDAATGFQIEVPDAWERIRIKGITLYAGAPNGATCSVFHIEDHTAFSPEYADTALEELTCEMDTVERMAFFPLFVADAPAVRVDLTGTARGRPLSMTLYYLGQNGRYFLVSLGGPPPAFASIPIDKMISSITIDPLPAP